MPMQHADLPATGCNLLACRWVCALSAVQGPDLPQRCRRFKCNMCGQLNEVMAEHFSPTGDDGKRMDLEQHPQLNSGSVELIAPAEYMVSRVCMRAEWPR